MESDGADVSTLESDQTKQNKPPVSIVRDSSGLIVGSVVGDGMVIRGSEKFIKVLTYDDKREEVARFIPETRFRESFKATALSLIGIKEEEIIDLVRNSNNQSLRDKVMKTLIEYAQFEDYSIEDFKNYSISDELRTELIKAIEEAKSQHYLFRGDLRHPYAKGNEDKKRGLLKGPFEIGMYSERKWSAESLVDSDTGDSERWDMGEEFSVVHMISTPSYALTYPNKEEGTIPPGWDGIKYLYFIDPKSMVDDPIIQKQIDVISKQRKGDIYSSGISSGGLAYAIEVNENTKQITSIYTNPKRLALKQAISK